MSEEVSPEEWFESKISDDTSGDQFMNVDTSIDNNTPFNANKSPTNNYQDVFSIPGLQTQMAANLAKTMFQSAGIPTKVPRWFSFSFLRPYFENVNEIQVLERMISTIYRPLAPLVSVINSPDLYGPMLSVFTLAIILVMTMKSSHVIISDGSLIGTSLFSCLGYWIGGSIILYIACKFFQVDLSLVSILSLVGYELAPLCVIAALSLFFSHFFASTILFYLLFLTLGVLSAASLGRTFTSKATNKQSGLILMITSVSMHLLFILYVRFAFISLYQAVSSL